ncbi:helix-turn-helix transcriptional regulator [Streptomyces sp. NPDC053427]|uniref:helix-turn-helix transcriptional regulator n=1 Tax=Streptomyces sp. NPDC053427 TaxID=3365701 RepID=UPI0037D40330
MCPPVPTPVPTAAPTPGPPFPSNPGDPESDPAVWRTRFLSLLDRIPAPTAVSTTEGGITLANPALAALWGLPPGRLAGRNLLDLFTPIDEGQLARVEAALTKGRRSRYPVQVRWTAGAATQTGQLTLEPVSDPGGESPPLLATLHIDEHPSTPDHGTPAPLLSAQESRILALIAAGCTTAVVARTVGLSDDGVNYHLTRLGRRLRTPNRTALIARAYVLGLLSPTAWPPEPHP